jgi:hypothetical protein
MKNKSLQECLSYIQTNLNAPKNRTNNFQNYKYRNLDDIFEGLKPLLKETGCVVTCTDSVEAVGDRVYIKAVAKLSKGEECISCESVARESDGKKGMDDAQLSGTCSSYSRKYALGGLFIIDDSQDVDSMDNRYTITDKQKERYQELLNSGAYSNDKAKINKWWKGFTTYEQAEAGLDHMQNHVDDFIEKHKERG